MYRFVMYSPLRSRKKGDLPAPPVVSVAVSLPSSIDDPYLLLTPHLINDTEIDYEVDGFIRELEEFRKAAKKELQKLKRLSR